MKRLLVVSPHFPPIDAPDMHRVRMSAPFFEEFGWSARVLAVDPAFQEGAQDPALVESVPSRLPITRVRALPVRATSKLGIGNIALRALPYLYSAGNHLIRRDRPDLVFFSTTMFPAMTLGRAWKRRFNVPYVVDMQDPWLTTYYEDNPGVRRPPKYRLAHRLDAVMEPWTMREVDGIVAVSDGYIETLRRRYPWIEADSCLTLPFGAATQDFDALARLPAATSLFDRDDGLLHGVYVGRGGDDMARALRVLFAALGEGLSRAPGLYTRVRLHFVGTDYAPPGRARKSVEPIARELGVDAYVTEETSRVPYFQALALMQNADFLVVVGSDDAQYTASKIYPYVLARRPVVAILHARSSAADLLRRFRAGTVATFGGSDGDDAVATAFGCEWTALLGRLPCAPETDWAEVEPYTARAMTQRLCGLFDKVLSRASLS